MYPTHFNTIFINNVTNTVLNYCVLDAICVGFLTLFLFKCPRTFVACATRNKGSFLPEQNLVMSILGSQSWLPILSAGPTHMNWISKCLHYIKAFTANAQTHYGKAALVDLTSCRDLKKSNREDHQSRPRLYTRQVGCTQSLNTSNRPRCTQCV